ARYTKRGADKFDEIGKVLAQSRVEADLAIEAHRRYASQLIGIMTAAVQKPREFSGAADSLAMAFGREPDLPNVTEYVEALHNGLANLNLDAVVPLPLDGEVGVGLFDVDGLGVAVPCQWCGKPVVFIEQPGIRWSAGSRPPCSP